jgi:hypothetical protein
MLMRTLVARALRKAASIISPASGPIDITDGYVTWLCFANAGMLDRGNLYLMDHAISRLPSAAPILEIGSFCGLSTNLLTHYKRKHSRTNKVITCDKWEFENNNSDKLHIAGSPVTFAEYKRLVRDSFLRNARTFSADDLPFTIELFSGEFFDLWKGGESTVDVFGRSVHLGGPLSFCYIDGNHSYEGARLDFENCDQFLELGGFILFDDSVNQQFGVKQLVREVLQSGRYKLVAKNPNHLLQKYDG